MAKSNSKSFINQNDYNFYKLRNQKLEEGRRKLHKKLKELSEEREKEIFEIINSYTIHSDGILIQTLAKLLNLHRKSITPYIQSLTKQGKIKRSEINGKIVSMSNIFEDPIINAHYLGELFRAKLLNKNNKNLILSDISNLNIQGTQKKIYNSNTNSYEEITEVFPFDSTLYKQYFEPKFTEKDSLEKMLFEFSNRIGSFITYLIIFAMNPDNYKSGYYHNKDFSALSNKNKDEIAKEIIRKGVLPIIPFLATSFRDMYDKRIGKYPNSKDFETKKEYVSRSPKYIINEKELVLALISAFTRLYPLMSYEFEKIMPEQYRYLFRDYLIKQPSGIEGYKKYMKEFYEHLKNQEKL